MCRHNNNLSGKGNVIIGGHLFCYLCVFNLLKIVYCSNRQGYSTGYSVDLSMEGTMGIPYPFMEFISVD